MAEIRQKIISCDKGHYYDANRYSQCPYCNPDLFPPHRGPLLRRGGQSGFHRQRGEPCSWRHRGL